VTAGTNEEDEDNEYDQERFEDSDSEILVASVGKSHPNALESQRGKPFAVNGKYCSDRMQSTIFRFF